MSDWGRNATAPRRQRIRYKVTHGWLRFGAKPSYGIIIRQQLALQRAIDSIPVLGSAKESDLITQLSALIKTFERPVVLNRLMDSILRLYPMLHVIVVDDSRQPGPVAGVQTVIMPYDTGVAAGRREGLRHVLTKYVLVLDDDFVLHRRTNLGVALDLMECHEEIDIMGGRVLNLPFYTSTDYSKAKLFPTEANPTVPVGSVVGGLPVYDKVANFFLARTERLRLVNWDPALKRIEHADFFTRAKGVLTTVYNRDMKCLHAPTPFDRAYMQSRGDHVADLAVLQHRYFGE